jgi:shikimate dehydrogenase
LGRNISNSLSPAIQNAAFAKLGIDSKYYLCDLKKVTLDQFVSGLDLSNVLGFNVTAPFKEQILKHLSSIDSRSKVIGAINTVLVSDTNQMQGFNTDYDGILTSLRKLALKKSSTKNKNMVILLGAGGAARACIPALINIGQSKIRILNRTTEKAKAVANHFAALFPESEIEAAALSSTNFKHSLQECVLVINTIPSLDPKYFPDLSQADRYAKVFDLNYKQDSLFLESAKNQGMQTMDGLLMFVEQAANSFKIWTKREAPRVTMMHVAQQALQGKNSAATRKAKLSGAEKRRF